MTNYDELAEQYVATWNERDDGARARMVASLFAADARYTDPLVDANGRDEITGAIGVAHQMFPDATFRLVGPADGHHDQLRFTWELGPEGGEAPVAGFDVVALDALGRMQTVLGFLDRVPVAP